VLDHLKLLAKFSSINSKLFPNNLDQVEIAKNIWDKISQDSTFALKVENSKSSFLLPRWSEKLNKTYKIESTLKDYSVLAIDGSQIYPDRNSVGSNCFLINVGGIFLKYGKNSSEAKFFCEPEVCLFEDFSFSDGVVGTKDFVDFKREESEFKFSFEQSVVYKPAVVLFDGTLIFWHLEGSAPDLKQTFLDMYISYLDKFYENQTLIAGYISYPKSKELVNLLKIGLCQFIAANCIECHKSFQSFPCKQVDKLIDTSITKFFVNKYERTILFESQSNIMSDYPKHLKIFFFYLDVGAEVVRIEVPAWIAKDGKKIDLICQMILDQVSKGNGYPISIAEAHEQAVVKSADREFFYHQISKIGIEKNVSLISSQKSIKKKGLGF